MVKEELPRENPAKGLSIGIIMDGNGRWAKQRGLPRTAGHKKGADVFEATVRHAQNLGVGALTFYAFSTENWSRPKAEVDMLMDLFSVSLKRLLKLDKEDSRVRFIGDRAPLKADFQKLMAKIEADTAGNAGMFVNVAINYGGQQEITRAARLLAGQVQRGELEPEDITEETVAENLYTAGQPMPHFILRTSGEQRISNFLLWQCAYSEFVFLDIPWPDFTDAHFDAAVQEYHSRQRRFGGI